MAALADCGCARSNLAHFKTKGRARTGSCWLTRVPARVVHGREPWPAGGTVEPALRQALRSTAVDMVLEVVVVPVADVDKAESL